LVFDILKYYQRDGNLCLSVQSTQWKINPYECNQWLNGVKLAEKLDGFGRILNQTLKLHQRVPFFCGNYNMVKKLNIYDTNKKIPIQISEAGFFFFSIKLYL
jgi:hypothetical protein